VQTQTVTEVIRAATRPLLWCGVLGGPLFVAAFLLEGARRPGYDATRQPVSALALGERGWEQRANFVGTGLLMLALSRGLAQVAEAEVGGTRWGPRCVALYAAGLIGSGVFVTDPVDGYPPDHPSGSAPTVTGLLHNLCALPVFGGLSAAAFLYARHFARSGDTGWAVSSALTGALVPSGLLLFGHALSQETGLGRVAGLIQRLTIAVGWGWIASAAMHFLRPEDGHPSRRVAG
jgi:hypothetical protein